METQILLATKCNCDRSTCGKPYSAEVASVEGYAFLSALELEKTACLEGVRRASSDLFEMEYSAVCKLLCPLATKKAVHVVCMQ